MQNAVQHSVIGEYKGIKIDLVTWDGTMADAELSCACMFMHEVNEAQPQGGLAHLNQALNGELLVLREQGWFTGKISETLLINRHQHTIRAPQLLIIGMGNPEEWTPEVSGLAVATAFRTGNQLGARSVAIAPSILDTGITPQTEFNTAMLQSLKHAIDTHTHLHELGLAQQMSVKHWIFDTGIANFDQKIAHFHETFAKVMTA